MKIALKQRNIEDVMQSEWNKHNDEQLNIFYYEDESEFDVCNVSTEYRDGWQAVSILIDSGASDSVAPKSFFPNVPVMETNASKMGLEYTAAGGHKIKNLGMCRPVVFTTDGFKHLMSFQVAGVSKALGAVSRIVGAGNRVIFDDPNTVGSFIENKTTGKITPLRQHNGITWRYG